ncbi:MAG: hypothetical protein C0598_14510 [Marinilabiliales bacterium]|nr:MAG: hypothetical protein C0598_14510 [Marinilabiliales bacterium]
MNADKHFDSFKSLKSKIWQANRKYQFNAGIEDVKLNLKTKAYGLELPESYKEFLNLCDGGMILEYEPEYYTDMTDDEPDGPKWSSFYFYPLEEVLDNYVGLSYDSYLVGNNFSGIYPIIPICRTPGPHHGQLVIISQRGLKTESPVFFCSPNKKKCVLISDNFNSFLKWYLDSDGFPKIDINVPNIQIEEFIKENNIIENAESESAKEGIERINSFLELFPNDAWSYCERANLNVKITEYKNALKDFNTAIELMDDEAFFYNCRGELLLNHGNARKALIDLDIAVNMDPEVNMYLSSRAKAFYKLGKLNEALKDCNAVLEKDYTDIVTLSIRFDVYKAMGEDDLAQVDSDLLDDLIR